MTINFILSLQILLCVLRRLSPPVPPAGQFVREVENQNVCQFCPLETLTLLLSMPLLCSKLPPTVAPHPPMFSRRHRYAQLPLAMVTMLIFPSPFDQHWIQALRTFPVAPAPLPTKEFPQAAVVSVVALLHFLPQVTYSAHRNFSWCKISQNCKFCGFNFAPSLPFSMWPPRDHIHNTSTPGR